MAEFNKGAIAALIGRIGCCALVVAIDALILSLVLGLVNVKT